MAIIGEILSGLIITYLSFTNTLADRITEVLGTPQTNTEEVYTLENEIPIESPSVEDKPTLSILKSEYEYGGTIPRILIENSSYQQAAALSANTSSSTQYQNNDDIKDMVSNALVNVYCTHTYKNTIRTTTGSGYFISENGIILTNAHIAQFLLLEDIAGIKNARCRVRTGSPASDSYTADILYISPLWITAHADLISKAQPSGTGERDYALLYVSGSATNEELPETFPFIDVFTELLPRTYKDHSVYVAGYPAESQITENTLHSLTSNIEKSTIHTLYTFGSEYADIFSVRNTAIGEHGASGGPITNTDGSAVGLITTKGEVETEGERSLRALTLSYIDRTITEETGFSLRENLSGDLRYRSNVFKEALGGFLRGILEENL